MKIICFGSTGSIPAPSSVDFDRRVFGGNTTSFLVELGEYDIIVDMGTGAKNVGKYLIKKHNMFSPTASERHIIVLLTHYHWDHIQGIPFFTPMYLHKNIVHFYGFDPRQDPTMAPQVESKVLDMLERQQSTPSFPVPFREMPAEKRYYSHSPMFSEKIFEDGILTITTVPLNHPDGCTGYIITENKTSKKAAFLFDNEPYPFPNANIVKLAKGSDIAFVDAQYNDAQISGMCQGFGHGTPELANRDCVKAEIKTVVGCHLDPERTDAQLFEIEKNTIPMVREGQIWEV